MAPRRRSYSPEVKKGKEVMKVKGTWTPEEDEVLQQHVDKYGPKDWSSIQSNGLLRRTGKSCRLRWVNKLRPGLKQGKFSPEEEKVVLEYQARLGNRWAEIAKLLTGRTDNDVKNFWSTRQKRLARQQRQLRPLLSEPPKGKRAVSHRGRGNTSSAPSLQWCTPQEPSSAMITFEDPRYEVDQSSRQEPLEEIHYTDAPMPGMLYLPAPDAAAMEPGSSSMVSYGTYAEGPAAPHAGADLPFLLYDKPTIPCISQQDPMYEVGQYSSQEPEEVNHSIDEVFCLPALVDATSAIPSCTNAEKPLRRAGTHLATLHHAAFVEPLAKKMVSAPLSPGTNFGDAPFFVPPDPREEIFVGSPPREVHYDDLPPRTRLFFEDPGLF